MDSHLSAVAFGAVIGWGLRGASLTLTQASLPAPAQVPCACTCNCVSQDSGQASNLWWLGLAFVVTLASLVGATFYLFPFSQNRPSSVSPVNKGAHKGSKGVFGPSGKALPLTL